MLVGISFETQWHHHLTIRRVASQLHLSQHALAPYGGLNKPASTQKPNSFTGTTQTQGSAIQ
ncbi:hypothetical protein Hanom_Chr08g00742571 [Helianthus anomalus]